MIKYLHTAEVRRQGRPQAVTKERLAELRGFRSVYGFPETTLAVIHEQRNMRRLANMPVFADEILLDFDDNPKAAELFEMRMFTSLHSFDKYDSGNRSVHFHVPIEPVVGGWVPDAVKDWVLAMAPGADMTIYHAAALYRLPGTWHEKRPGNRKKLLVRNTGSLLPKLEPPKYVAKPLSKRPTSISKDRLLTIINKPQGEGGRRCYAWYVGISCYDAGLEIDQAFEIALQWNTNKVTPMLEDEVVIQKIEEAYQERESR